MKRAWGILVLLMAITLGALAQDQAPRTDQQQAHLRLRIRQGWNQGDLTRREAMRLMAAQWHIRRSECLAKADGRINRVERMRLHRMHQRANREIFRQRHDRQSRMY